MNTQDGTINPFEQQPLHYNPINGSIGVGHTYGEYSYNNQPNMNAPLSKFWPNPDRSPYDPFSLPNLQPPIRGW